jgi:hypothetical protein
MPGAPTPNLGLTVPTVGGDVNNWGTELNGDLAILDGLGAFTVYQTAIGLLVAFTVFPEVIVLATGGAGGISVQLPACASWAKKIALVKKVDAAVGVITVSCIAGLIDGLANYPLVNQFQYVRLLSDGVNANVVGNN